MKHALYLKFIAIYVFLAFIGVFIITTLGRQLEEDHLVETRANAFYREETAVMSSYSSSLFTKSSSLDSLYKELKTLADGTGASFRIIDESGQELICTERALNTDSTVTIPDFNYTDFGPRYYEISNFYGQYSYDCLNVMIPITYHLNTYGYIAASLPYSEIQNEADRLLDPFYVVFAANFALSLLILAFFSAAVYHPLQEIKEGAREFASGNLTHRIRIHSRDEMGEIADSMNFMADELKKNADYQKKFISNVSHDFRTPLTSIKGFTEAMSDGTIPPDMHGHYLSIIAGETDKLDKLTREVLTLNAMDQAKFALNIQDFDINDLMRQTASLFESVCRKKKISINAVMLGDRLMVSADREKIGQVIYNLLDNAVKFSDKNTTITMETSERHGKCYVSIKDEGCGIPRECLPKIWDRFYKADSSRGRDRTGTGLGLSIVKEIISAHEQNISVMSTEGVGTEFVFSLALAKQA
ncbi:MAG: HAMP domain-containing sensor histidine kinase [Eubacteriales bacterium]|jgi:signal transduction histidine kinase